MYPACHANIGARLSPAGNSERHHQDLVVDRIHVMNYIEMNIPEATAAWDNAWNKLKMLPAWDCKNVQQMTEVVRDAMQKRSRTLGIFDDFVSLVARRACPTPSEVERKSGAPGVNCHGQLWFPSSLCRARSFSFTGACRKTNGYNINIAS